MTDDNFQILPNTKPVIKGGKYELKATLKDTENLIGEKTITWNFSVAGDPPETPASSPQKLQALSMPAMAKSVPVSSPVPGKTKLRTTSALTFKQTDIQAVFPPAGNLGNHSDLLPDLTLNHSTLPWEYWAVPERNDLPWLALLLFDEEECPEPQVKALAGLQEENFEIEPGQDPNGTVTVIDVRREVLERILPSGNDLTWMAHVRRGSDEKETAVIVCNRLPKFGGTSTVHLVSMAGRYQGIPGQEMFDYQNATSATDLVRLVSVYHWQFTCQDEQHKFKNLLLQIDSGTLRWPRSENADAEKYLARGCVPLRHITR